MELAAMSVEPVDAVRFGRWPTDLHRPEALIWTDQHRVRALVTERTLDGVVELAVDDLHRLEAIADGRRLAMVFRTDRTRLLTGHLAPLVTTSYTVDRDRGTVRARFADTSPDRRHRLPTPVTATLTSPVLFQRRPVVSLVGLSLYQGELRATDHGQSLLPGMTATLTFWLPWLGEVRLLVQLTEVTGAGQAGVRFRIVDRASVERAAIVLTGTIEEFDYADLTATGVRPSRISKYLTVHTVADDEAFGKALEVRRLGNRKFGRLAGVADAAELVDELDPYSVNFICCLGDKPLGTGRVVINGGRRDRSEIEHATEGLPEDIWAAGFVEISRLAIHPDYNRGGVIVAIFREVARLAFNLDCRFLVLDAIEKLVPSYQKIGANRLPLTKVHPYSKETVQVMAIDIAEQLSHVDSQLVYWQYVFGPVLRHFARTSQPEVLTRQIGGLDYIPFWLKRLLSRAF